MTLWCKNHQNPSYRKSHTWAPLKVQWGRKLHFYSSYSKCANTIPRKELRGHSPNFHIHVSVSDLYIQTIDLTILLQENMWTDLGNTVYKSLTWHMNVEIGTEAARFPEKECINGIFFAVRKRSAIKSGSKKKIAEWSLANEQMYRHCRIIANKNLLPMPSSEWNQTMHLHRTLQDKLSTCNVCAVLVCTLLKDVLGWMKRFITSIKQRLFYCILCTFRSNLSAKK